MTARTGVIGAIILGAVGLLTAAAYYAYTLWTTSAETLSTAAAEVISLAQDPARDPGTWTAWLADGAPAGASLGATWGEVMDAYAALTPADQLAVRQAAGLRS